MGGVESGGGGWSGVVDHRSRGRVATMTTAYWIVLTLIANWSLRGSPWSLCLTVECCFSATETVGLLGTGAQDVHLDFHTVPELPSA